MIFHPTSTEASSQKSKVAKYETDPGEEGPQTTDDYSVCKA